MSLARKDECVTPQFDDAVRDVLLRERARAIDRVDALTQQLDDIVSSSEQSATDDEHDPEGHTLAFERQQLVALLENARARVTEVDAAVSRLDSAAYGVCERCGRPIARERLVALPTARTCIACAT
jgi:RNA polymerase-binding transcription factor DksA